MANVSKTLCRKLLYIAVIFFRFSLPLSAGVTKPVDPVEKLVNSSNILDGLFEEAKPLIQWMEDRNFHWKLCYRASRDGWAGEDFHSKCDDVGPSVTLVKCGTNVFGGFTDQSWKPLMKKDVYTKGLIYKYKRSDVSFMFSLCNEKNLPSFKCSIREDKENIAIICYSTCGVVFGGGHDLHISNNANTNQCSYSNLGCTYQAPQGYQYNTPQTQSLLAGSKNFQPSEIEVYRG